MKTRKKLPLPAGGQASKASKKSKIMLAALLVAVFLLAACLAGYFLLLPGKGFTSSKAFLNGSFLEIRVNVPGRVEYAAKTGQPVTAGDLVLRMNTAEYASIAKSAEAAVNREAGAIPERSRNLMLRYLAIPQTEAELAEAVQKALAREKNYKNILDDLTARQAVFSLELRRLELKRERLDEEEARMEAMRIEENLLRDNLRRASDEFETASLERAAAEKRLHTKRELGRALRSLPVTQREQLYALETQFFKMYEAERQIELASVTSPKNGLIIYAALAPGATAQEGDLALYILPDKQPELWVTAYFTSQHAARVRLGSLCTVTVDGPAPLTLRAMVAEKIPDAEPGQTGKTPFKITFTDLAPEQLIGIKPGQPVVVNLN